MKTKVRKKDNFATALEHLGGISAQKFLKDYWQKRPLLVRGAFPNLIEPLSKQEIFALAARDDAESRLISRNGAQWQLTHGPISRRQMATAKKGLWTLLLQDTQHFSRKAHQLLAAFNFIPHARVDDLMVSYAIAGAGVGPHIDSYDVFLLQGSGSRRWRISAQKDLRLKEGAPLKLLAKFKPEQEFVLKTGDMLYLPPGYAHDGIAESECLTWSIGFRAPSSQELGQAFLDYVRDDIKLGGQYEDADLIPTATPGAIDRQMRNRFAAMIRSVVATVATPATLDICVGRYLTEPKQHVYFDYPEPELAPAAFRKAVLRHGLRLDLKSRMLYDEDRFFINGEQWQILPADRALFRILADCRELTPPILTESSTATALNALHVAYTNGFVRISNIMQEPSK
ncbi:MAG: cupin domain-containing protein [Betaproteobacteria bacterium]|nr:cupin domain-containing protein [Betaproteobacteria bacterium]